MKIIGKVSDSSYIVEMSPDEIARSAGFESAWGTKWWEMVGPVGTVKATNGDDVWVQLADNKMQTWPANLTRLYDEKAGAA